MFVYVINAIYGSVRSIQTTLSYPTVVSASSYFVQFFLLILITHGFFQGFHTHSYILSIITALFILFNSLPSHLRVLSLPGLAPLDHCWKRGC